MWNQPYLETCCRASLHRVVLAGPLGRPDGLKDGPCLVRLAGMDLVRRRADGRYEITDLGLARHDAEILKRPGAAGASAATT
ncbi:MAG: hypothetical protein ACREFU_16465 [Acetobacteraceae bacterium]